MSTDTSPLQRVPHVPDAVQRGTARRVHITAICGVAMSALAGMLKQCGYEVSGSDENVYPPISTLLERAGIPVQQGYRAENLSHNPDLVVVGNKVSRTNPEVQALLHSEIPYASFPQTLGALFLADKKSLVVAGTHGKTTTTALLGWVLASAGRDPSVLVGGEVFNFGGNFTLGAGEHFVIEGDEYDTAFFDKGPKFLHYRPHAAILNAVEFDHADIYQDLDAVKASFRRLIDILPAGAPLVVAAEDANAREVAATHDTVLTCGLTPDAEWQAAQLRDDGTATCFDVLHRGQPQCTVRIPQPGAINARNALAVYVLARAMGVADAEITDGIASFKGVARRQQVIGTWNDITVIDDFAHHPTAVEGAIAAIRFRYPNERLWAVFEPRSNTSRRKVFQQQYVNAFAAADEVIIGSVFQKSTDTVADDALFSPEQLVADLHAKGLSAQTLPDAEHIADVIAQRAQPGDVILVMSNGSFDGLLHKLTTRLQRPA